MKKQSYTAELVASNKLTLEYTFWNGDEEVGNYSLNLTSEQYDNIQSGTLQTDGEIIDGKKLNQTDSDGNYYHGDWIQA